MTRNFYCPRTAVAGAMLLFVFSSLLVLIGCNPTGEFQLIDFGPVAVVQLGPHGAQDDDEHEEEDDEREAADQSESEKENENDLLKEMEKPLFALFVTGRQSGYIEPCGCTGLYNQKGGLMRRHRVQQILAQRGWDLVCIDAGNQIRRFGQQPMIKLQHTWQALTQVMKYDAIGFGPDDLKITTIDLLQMISNLSDGDGPFVSANVDLLGEGMQDRVRIVERAGKQIGITHALDDTLTQSLRSNSDLVIKSLADGIRDAVAEMQSCDVRVLILQTDSVATARQIASSFPVFDLIVHTTSAGEPEKLPTSVQTGDHLTQMIQVGVKGMYVGVVAYYPNGNGLEMKYERVPLDGRFTDSKLVEKVFESYQRELELLYTKGQLMDVKPRPHPSGFKFVGSQACFDCHSDEFEIWEDGVDGEGGPHFIATDDIVTPPNHRGHIPRHFDPECLSCHVTGWNPQGFFPYESGFISLEKHKHLHGNGCENCHGPGSEHVRIEQAKDKGLQFDEKELEGLRKAMRLTLEQAREQHCGQCHDVDNSPDFLKEGAFEEYWEQIEH